MAPDSDLLIARLVERLHDADPVARRNAAGALRLHGRRAACAAPQLAELLEDEDAKVQAEARRALDRLTQAVA
jgi:HEAT repeat protein